MPSRIITLTLALAFLLGMTETQARPPYADKMAAAYKDFQKKFPDSTGKRISCSICHVKEGGKTNFKKRNNYGFEVGSGLQKKNDTANIAAAIKKAEAADSATKGQTYGDLIKALKRPGTNDEKK